MLLQDLRVPLADEEARRDELELSEGNSGTSRGKKVPNRGKVIKVPNDVIQLNLQCLDAGWGSHKEDEGF